STSENAPLRLADGGVRAISVPLDHRDEHAGRAAVLKAAGVASRLAVGACGLGSVTGRRAGRASQCVRWSPRPSGGGDIAALFTSPRRLLSDVVGTCVHHGWAR